MKTKYPNSFYDVLVTPFPFVCVFVVVCAPTSTMKMFLRSADFRRRKLLSLTLVGLIFAAIDDHQTTTQTRHRVT